jgi:hypothetical protein
MPVGVGVLMVDSGTFTEPGTLSVRTGDFPADGAEKHPVGYVGSGFSSWNFSIR